MNGTEQTLFENTELGEYNGHIFLDKMQAGDTIVLKIYVKDHEDDVYKLRDSATYTGAQTKPCVGFLPTIGKVGLKVTAQQTAGTYRTVTHQWIMR